MIGWVFRVVSVVAGIVIILVSILAGLAQIMSFYFDHRNVVVESLKNVAGYFGTTTVSDAKCARYEKRFEPVGAH